MKYLLYIFYKQAQGASCLIINVCLNPWFMLQSQQGCVSTHILTPELKFYIKWALKYELTFITNQLCLALFPNRKSRRGQLSPSYALVSQSAKCIKWKHNGESMPIWSSGFSSPKLMNRFQWILVLVSTTKVVKQIQLWFVFIQHNPYFTQSLSQMFSIFWDKERKEKAAQTINLYMA
jgi:hypothetical protein